MRATEGETDIETDRQRYPPPPHPCTCLQNRKTAAALQRALVWAKVRSLRDTEKHTAPHTLSPSTNTHQSRHKKTTKTTPPTHTDVDIHPNTSANACTNTTQRKSNVSYSQFSVWKSGTNCSSLSGTWAEDTSREEEREWLFLMLMDNAALITALYSPIPSSGTQSPGMLGWPIPALFASAVG